MLASPAALAFRSAEAPTSSGSRPAKPAITTIR